MNTQKLLKRVAVTVSAATLALALGACAHHAATAGDDYGQVRPEAAAAQQQKTPDQVVGTAPAPANAQNVTSPSAPAVIPGPAKVDNSGNAYTSSSVGSAGNGSATGLNTNVNLVPKTSTSSVTVTQSPAVVAETTPAPAPVVETPAPAPPPAPVITEKPAESVPMTSSTTTQTQTTETTTPKETKHRRMRKD